MPLTIIRAFYETQPLLGVGKVISEKDVSAYISQSCCSGQSLPIDDFGSKRGTVL
jgi:hypothetical protein